MVHCICSGMTGPVQNLPVLIFLSFDWKTLQIKVICGSCCTLAVDISSTAGPSYMYKISSPPA